MLRRIAPTFTPTSRAAWRGWLAKNHAAYDQVTVVLFKKHTGKAVMSAHEGMREAICYGWIDSTSKSLGETTWQINYHRRNSNARWSNNTLAIAQDLIATKQMAPPGLAAYEYGKSRPKVDSVAKSPTAKRAPEALLAKLKKSKKAHEFYAGLPAAAKAKAHGWVWTAKLDDTKARRIDKLVALFKESKRF
jgi:uncharacterized protein YdeI (YjbR/CyaY-like superfamily)